MQRMPSTQSMHRMQDTSFLRIQPHVATPPYLSLQAGRNLAAPARRACRNSFSADERKSVRRNYLTLHARRKSTTTICAQTISSSTPAASADPAEDGLVAWLQANGMSRECHVSLKDRPAGCSSSLEPCIRYLAASKDLNPGDLALQMPWSLVVTLERILGDETIAELLTTSKLSELACLALYLMYEKKRGQDSFWAPFIRELDRQRGRGQMAVESPLLWEEKEVEEYLEGSPMKAVIYERLDGMKREYEELDTVWFMAGSLFKEYPFDQPTEAFPFPIFKQAFVAVQACVVHLQGVSLPRRFALVPLGPPLLAYNSSCKAMLKPTDEGVELRVDRAVKEGQPVVAWCGPQPNARLLLNYGIVDEDNPYDRLTVEAALDMKDPLYQKKRAIVQKNERLSVHTFQIYRGREMDAVHQMMPYLRLGHVPVEEELESVTFADGPVCGISPSNEASVLFQLQEYFQQRLDKYRTNIQEDEQIIANPNTSPRRRVATQLLRIEKTILLNVLEAIEQTIVVLPEQHRAKDSLRSNQFRPVLR